MKLKVYISGKITGDADYKRKFESVEQELKAMGHIVLNPAMQPEGLSNTYYMQMAFGMMGAADVVLFLTDYTQSRGAMLEYAWCQYVGKQCAYDIKALQ